MEMSNFYYRKRVKLRFAVAGVFNIRLAKEILKYTLIIFQQSYRYRFTAQTRFVTVMFENSYDIFILFVHATKQNINSNNMIALS